MQVSTRSGSDELGDEVSVVNVSSTRIESRHKTISTGSLLGHLGAAQLSPDNRRLYLTRQHSIQCLNLSTGQELWQTERQPDFGMVTLAVSPDGQALAWCSGYEDSTIHIGDAATGHVLVHLAGHTTSPTKLVFSKDGRRLISAARDQTIRFWDTKTWTEMTALRGNTDAIFSVALSEPAHFVASAAKDGNLMLWKDDGKSATDAYRRLPEGYDQLLPLSDSRALLLSSSKPPELIDLKRDSSPVSMPELRSSANVLGWFGTNILCHWNGTNQILVSELIDTTFVLRGAIPLDSAARPTGFTYNPRRHLLAWSEAAASNSVHVASLADPGHRVEMKSDVPGLLPFQFSEDGKYVAASTTGQNSVFGWYEEAMLRAWNVETGQIVASSKEPIAGAIFAADEMLVAVIVKGNDHELGFFDLAHPGQTPRLVPGILRFFSLSVSPNGRLVAAPENNQVRLFDPTKGALIDTLHGHLNQVFGVAFSPDGRRLISASGGGEAIKLWDVRTGQELLTLAGAGSLLFAARWSADADVILASDPWQAWRAPSWDEIAAAEAQEKKSEAR